MHHAGTEHRPPVEPAPDLPAVVELNSAEWLRLQGRLPWVQFHEDADALRVFTPEELWPRNSVALARFAADTARGRVSEILSFHLQHKAPCNWIVGPVSRPLDLGKHLRAHGFRCMLHSTAMACDLRDSAKINRGLTAPAEEPADIPGVMRGRAPSLLPGVRVAAVKAAPSLYPLTTERRRRRHEGRNVMARLEPERVTHFAATLSGRPVGETTLFLGAGVAGVYDVEVLEGFRSRGLGTALVSAALERARALGCPAAVLAATCLGLGVYERLGFRQVGRLSFWNFGKMRQQTT
jgi:GNAT superfamily N-acetyltransferase